MEFHPVKIGEIAWVSRSRLREIISVHIEDDGNIFGEGGFLEDVLDVVGKGTSLVGAESDLKTELIVGFDERAG
jgi:hypothetical protein